MEKEKINAKIKDLGCQHDWVLFEKRTVHWYSWHNMRILAKYQI